MATTQLGKYPHNVNMPDIAKLEVPYVIFQRRVDSFVWTQENEHRLAQHKGVVVLKHNCFDSTGTIYPYFQADTCFASNLLAPPNSLPLTLNNTCCLLTLSDTSKIPPILVVLAPFHTKPCMPCISVVKFIGFILGLELLTNGRYQMVRELWGLHTFPCFKNI